MTFENMSYIASLLLNSAVTPYSTVDIFTPRKIFLLNVLLARVPIFLFYGCVVRTYCMGGRVWNYIICGKSFAILKHKTKYPVWT